MATKLSCNLFELAEKQLIKELDNGKRRKYNRIDVINYAVKIRKFLDEQEENKTKMLFKKRV